jgi:hypothetical protein
MSVGRSDSETASPMGAGWDVGWSGVGVAPAEEARRVENHEDGADEEVSGDKTLCEDCVDVGLGRCWVGPDSFLNRSMNFWISGSTASSLDVDFGAAVVGGMVVDGAEEEIVVSGRLSGAPDEEAQSQPMLPMWGGTCAYIESVKRRRTEASVYAVLRKSSA